MKCTSCNGLLIWDYEHGEIVCSSCGLVYDKLTSLDVLEYTIIAATEVGKSEKWRSLKHYPSKEYKRKIRLYREGLKLVKDKPWLEVNFDRVFENGKFIHTIVSRASQRALKNIEIHGYWKVVQEGLEYIRSINPALLARSERSKYALAYIVAIRFKTGEYPDKNEVTKVFNISDTSYRRLCTLAEKLFGECLKIRNYLNSSRVLR